MFTIRTVVFLLFVLFICVWAGGPITQFATTCEYYKLYVFTHKVSPILHT